MDLHLTGKTAIVLASSTGLGKAVAKELALEGANVMITSRNKDKLVQAKEEIEQVAKGRVEFMVADVTDAHSIKALVDVTRQTFGKINILVNNTGGPSAGSFEDLTDQDFQKAFDLTLMSYIRAVREVLPDLKETRGHILNNTSSSVKQPIDGLLLSNVFRMGVQGLSKSLSQELAQYGIMVNTIGAGRIATDRLTELDQNRAEREEKTVDDIQASIKDQIPAGRYGEPEEFAKMATFLVSGVNTYVTGQTILVDGALSKAY
ncbi:SDR family oxidoreductase [Alkalibacterium olivapovliticus]|uniref:3-oxoacyl-[acyl-carrier protein] reductase n=1 Tax=Alkalibacterium olivapovliticus TaxID=99907 RepID=A0A2T0W7X0_9LACT|nr:SDR family oxidoreductase [Alkalibacterium olivapovliticus]PRY82769.1 3-oxoacyl-[acyl-carrier protein] reductase [Alkalibacterium olivapovliticus]